MFCRCVVIGCDVEREKKGEIDIRERERVWAWVHRRRETLDGRGSDVRVEESTGEGELRKR